MADIGGDPTRILPPPSATIESVQKGPLHQFIVVVSELQPAALEQIKQAVNGDRIRVLEAILRDLVKTYNDAVHVEHFRITEVEDVVDRARAAVE